MPSQSDRGVFYMRGQTMWGWAADASTVKIAALHALQTCVMVTDSELTITYVNPALAAFLRAMTAELRQDAPDCSVAGLIGSKLDVLLKLSSVQRSLLLDLEKTQASEVRFGRTAIDLVVTPFGRPSDRTHFVVEWADASGRLLNLDHQLLIETMSRSQAMIEFAADGTVVTANQNFLRTMGYRLDEVVGSNHSMFVRKDQQGDDYQEFWARLRRGEYQAAQFRRIAKDGRELWIEGTYNPIRDASGKVCKVVKFATDITQQINLLANLKTLIDQNFGEIDGAITLSTSEARSAATAAGDTADNVRSVAASAEQLAASVSEISQSMVTSRAATDNAFEQAVAVGKSTESLAGAAQAMNGIVGLIRDVASQINLLALNATIEAARAGEAGKGFAVVASEVKNLAIQAAKATEQISTEIDGIQTTSSEVAGALGAIRDAVTTVRESVTLTASAVEEQSAVTRSMSSNMRNAAGAVATVSNNINEISAAVQQAAQAVAKTKQAAEVLVR